VLDGSLCLRDVIFRNKDFGECASWSWPCTGMMVRSARAITGATAGVVVVLEASCELMLQAWIDDANKCASEGTGVLLG
jgi:hypothetical protein